MLPADDKGLSSLKHRRVKLYGRVALEAVEGDKVPLMFLGPRIGREVGADFAYDLYVPLALSASGQRVLLNVGKVPFGKEAQTNLHFAENEGIEAVLEEGEGKPFLTRPNDVQSGIWTHRNVLEMAAFADTEPIIFKRISRRVDKDHIPIASPPKIEVSNRHLEYVVTWYGIAAASYALSFIRRA